MAKRSANGKFAPLELVDVASIDDTIAAPDPPEAEDRPKVDEPFETFYRREFPRLVALAHALAGHGHAADVAQEAMIVAYRRWDIVRDYTSPAGLVRGVCAHKAISVVRRRAIEERALARLRLRRPPPTDPANGADDEFWQEVRQLPRRQAQVTQATVDGRQAWTVRVRMRRPRHDGPTVCNLRFACTPVLALTSPNDSFLGSRDTMVSDYTFVDLRGVGSAAI